MKRLGMESRGPGRVYLVGGASAVLLGWRTATVDIDLKLDPEPAGVFEAVARAKDALNINVELAAPDDFMPALPGWRDRSVFIDRNGPVDFFHYDFYAQALAKIERGHERDLLDIDAMQRQGLIEPDRLTALFREIEPALIRYPAIEPASLRDRVEAAVGGDEPVREVPKDLPGADLVASGIEALRRGQLTVEALLVAVGAHRLRSAGLSVPRTPELPNSPELALYSALGATHPRDTHSRYNSLIRRLVSFQRALELRSRCRRDPALKRSHAASVRGSRHLVPGRRSQNPWD